MKAGKKMLDSRIEEFCRNSTELLENIHVRCDNTGGAAGNGQSKKGRKKRTKRK